MIKWRDLGFSIGLPKVHGIEDHLLNQMVLYKGIGCFTEDFVEKAHQDGNRDETRSSNTKDRQVAASCNSRWEFARHDSAAALALEYVTRSTSRKRKRFIKQEKDEERKKIRVDRREQCRLLATLEPNIIEDYIAKGVMLYSDDIEEEYNNYALDTGDGCL
jgi:hypothetical protein